MVCGYLRSAALVALGLTAACLPSPVRAANPPLIAYVAANGEVTVRKEGSGNLVASIRPGFFEQTWQLRGLSPSGAFAPGASASTTQTTGSISAATSGAVVAVQTRVSLAAPNVLRFSFALTPDKPLKVNSVHVSVSVPASDFVLGTGTGANGARAIVPASASGSLLLGGTSGPLTLQKNGVILSASAPGKSGILQDNRAFGGTDLEMRWGTQSNAGGDWPAQKTETFDLTVTLPQTVQIVREAPVTLRADGVNWIPLDIKLDPVAGSALDFSKLLLDGPAGKYGRVVVRPDGHFGFAQKNAPVRFYGVNFAFSANYLSHAEADRIADRLARIGYNSVRIHHYEGELIDPNAPDTIHFRSDRLDKLDYLIYALKKRGIYLTTDLFVSRPVKNEETGLANGASDFKAALLVSPPAMENWKAFSRNLLTHVNPYTGIAYKDESALAFISVVNEPNLPGSLAGMTGALRAAYEKEWRTYLASRYVSDAALQTAWAQPAASRQAVLPKSVDMNTAQGRDLGAFLAFLHERGYRTMRDFLKNEIGTSALLTDNNGWTETPALMAARTQLDYVDNHFYWDHPSFLEQPWNLPSRGGSGGGSATQAGGAGPSGLAQTRLVGKPFTVSEFNYAAPNRFRAEGGLLMGAASALQDWDAVWRFAYSHSREASLSPAPVDYFNMANDPAGQASERAALLLFLRGDLRPAPGLVTLVRKRGDLETPGPNTPPAAPGFGDLTLLTRIGTRIEDANAPLPSPLAGETRFTVGNSADAFAALKNANKLPLMNRTDLTGGDRESETGELSVDAEQNLLRLQTDRTAGGIANPGDTFAAGPLTITVSGSRAVVWASSLDNLPIRRSRRLLVVHVPDVENSGMVFAGPDRQVLTAWGGLPHLARQGKATLTLSRSVPGTMVAYRLDTAGNRVGSIPLVKKNDAVTFTVSTLEKGASDATLYYEIVATAPPAVKAAAVRKPGGNRLQ